jgi:MFS family permease
MITLEQSAIQTSPVERAAVRKVMWHVLPLLFAAYFVAYIDRVNVGFAALTMNPDLGLSAEQYGLAGGLFFVGYVAFSIPSNLFLARLGARLWIPLITTMWGIASLLNAFIVGPHTFYIVRFILGVGEAGLYPGLLYILLLWAPERYRVRMLMLLILSTPFSIMVGSLVSQPILMMDGLMGLRGWQWLFVMQALPTIALGYCFRFALPPTPAQASWLPEAEKTWLVNRLEHEKRHRESVRHFSVMGALTNRVVWLIALAGVGINAAAYGLILFLPQIIHQLGVSATMTPLVNAIPFAVAAAAMVWWSIRSDHKRERYWHSAIPAAISGLGLIACAVLHHPIWIMVALTVGISGVFCYVSVFWAVPSAMLTGSAAAAGLAMINGVANLGSFYGPFMMGWVRDITGSFTLGIVVLGIGPLVASLIAISLRTTRKFESG